MWASVFFGALFSCKILNKNKFLILISWALLSAVAVFPGYYFRNHYYLFLLPAVSVYFGLFFDIIFEWANNQHKKIYQVIPPLFFLLCIIYYLASGYDFFIKDTPAEASVSMYWSNVFNNAVIISNYIINNTKKEDKILVIGSEPEIYFYTQRKAATGYIYIYPLMERHPFRDSMLSEFIHQSIINKPQLIINSRNPWFSDSFQNAIIYAITPPASKYILKSYCYTDSLQHKDIFVESGNENNIPKQQILWEIYGLSK